MELTPLENKLVNGWQRDFPLTPRPFAAIGAKLGLAEHDVMAMVESLQEKGVLSRLGAIVRPNTVGKSALIAMRVPPDDLEKVAATVGAEEQVNHNYERENELNLWFVVTARDADDLEQVLCRIEHKTGLETVKLPLEKAYHIDLGFTL